MKRMHLKRRKTKRKKTKNIIIFIIILLIISVIYIFKIFNEKAIDQFISYSEIETKKIVSAIINNTVINEVSNNIDFNELFITAKDSNGDIKSIDFNSSTINKILSDTTRLIERNLKYLETGEVEKLNLYNISESEYKNLKKGIIYELPSGIMFNNSILNNILPKIPIKINLIGDMFCRINTDVESYGINNALIKVSVFVQVEVKILMPFVSSITNIESNIPIVMKLIEGDVPSYYFDGYLSSPSLTTSVIN